MILLPSARADLDLIGDTIAIDSPRRAVTFVAELVHRCNVLRDFPERFPLVTRYQDQGVRRAVHGEYLIFYTIRAETVFILHVQHGRMDHENLVFPEI